MAELDDLNALAPDVDTDAALAEFRRQRARTPKRWPALAAAAALVVAGIVGIAVLAADDSEPVVAGPADADTDADGAADPQGAVEFDVLFVLEGAEEMGTLRAATTADEYDDLLPGGVGPLAAIDFTSTVVVSITIPDDACPPDLTEFRRDGATITPVFVETAPECIVPLIPKTYIVAIDRASVGTTFSVLLPADETYDIDERILVVQLGESPTCADIERFSEKLVDVGIAYGYDASQSPAEVFEYSDLVFLGRLTGGFANRTASGDGNDSVGYEVEIDTLYKGPPTANLTSLQTIEVSVGSVDSAEFEAAITPGVPVIVFSEYLRSSLARPTAGVEGFVTGCPGGPLLGFTGFQGEWAEISDLDDLAARLDEVSAEG